MPRKTILRAHEAAGGRPASMRPRPDAAENFDASGDAALNLTPLQ